MTVSPAGPLPPQDPRDAQVALFQRYPSLVDVLPWAPLGVYPTAVEALPLTPTARSPRPTAELWIKREDQSAPAYGGNKVRTIEGHVGRALHRGQRELWASGAFGSNHALCTALNAPRVGLSVGVALFPQPVTAAAQRNLRATLSTGVRVAPMPSTLLLPWVLGRLFARRGAAVMTPGGAIPIGCLGHVSGGLELAGQIAAGTCPEMRHVVLAVGSTCTSAGLLLGVQLAAALGIGPATPPTVHAVRIGPWPFTSKSAILWLARRTLRTLEGLLGRALPVDVRRLGGGLRVHGDFIGRGYGFPTAAGDAATRAFAAVGGPALDPVYTAKSAAALLALAGGSLEGPVVYWATKSTRPLPPTDPAHLARATPQMQRWLARPALPSA